MLLMIKMTAHRINQTRITSFFLILGMVFSMLLVSIGISFGYEHIYAGRNKSENTPPHGELYSVFSDGRKQLNANRVKKLFKGMREETGVIFNNLLVHPDRAELDTYCPVSAEWFVRDDGWHYPLVSGRYYTSEEIKNGEKVALVGNSRKEDMREENGKQYIDIGGEAYEVLGIVGIEDQVSLWDNRIFMPCTALPGEVMEDMTLHSVNFILYNESGELSKDQKVIEKNGDSMASDFEIEDEGAVQTEDMAQALLQSQDPIYSLILLGYAVVLIYAINIVVFWLEKRRYEIGLRKAFGYTDRDIARLIFGEMFGLALFSGIVALVIQMVAGSIADRIFGYTLKLYLPNIMIALGVVLLTAILTSICPVIRALRIPSADTLKEGE